MTLANRQRIAFLAVALLFVLLVTGTAQAKVYWFEKYQRAVDLIDAGDVADGAGLIQQLIESHPIPKNAARVPGNQYIDYLPYYQWARAQAKLGNGAAASEGLDRSIDFGAINESRRHVQELDQLRRTIRHGLSPETASDQSPATATVVRSIGN